MHRKSEVASDFHLHPITITDSFKIDRVLDYTFVLEVPSSFFIPHKNAYAILRKSFGHLFFFDDKINR